MKILAKRLALLFWGFLIGGLVAEAATRSLLTVYSSPFYRLDKNTGLLTYAPGATGVYRRACFSNQIEINSLGWRTPEFSSTKPLGVYRLLVLGDSFTAALEEPVEKTFTQIIARKLEEQFPGRRFEAISLGRGNSGLYEAYRYLKDYGMVYDPDLILIVSFYNDPLDDIRAIEGVTGSEKIAHLGSRGEIIDDYKVEENGATIVFKDLVRQSAFLKLLYDRSHDFVDYVILKKPKPFGDELLESLDEDRAFSLQKQVLINIKNLASSLAAPVIIFNAPYRRSVEDSADPNEPYLAIGKYDYESYLQKLSDATGVVFVNLLPTIRQRFYREGKAIDSSCDIHWNETGHLWVAEAMLTHLLENLSPNNNL